MFEKIRSRVRLVCCMRWFVILAFGCDKILALARRKKTGLWATVPVAGEGIEQGATNVAFPPPLEGTVMGAGGRNAKYVVKYSVFFLYICENL